MKLPVKNLKAAEPSYVAFDFETTGLSPRDDRIIEIGAVRFDEKGQEVDRYESLVNPQRPSSRAAFFVHGISDEETAAARPASAVLPEFLRFLGEPSTTTLIAHNASFDASFLGAESVRNGLPLTKHVVVDTLALARRRFPHLRNHKLDALCRMLGLSTAGSHRALGDSLRVMSLWLSIRDRGETLESPLAYPVHDPLTAPTVPSGLEDVSRAINSRRSIRITYSGGSRGAAPREVSPRRVVHRGGVAYMVAYCHIDLIEKEFRLDRVTSLEVVENRVD